MILIRSKLFHNSIEGMFLKNKNKTILSLNVDGYVFTSGVFGKAYSELIHRKLLLLSTGRLSDEIDQDYQV